MSSSSTGLPTPEGPGSVSGAPNLPEGFTDTFTSRYVDTGDVRLHAVIGGDGPPLLLIHGWPGSWYYWRLVMPALARDFEVIAVDQRGIGLSDKPEEGYDTGTLANDLVGLMDALGHERFAVVGVDTGMLIGYALAADHPDRVVRSGRRRGPAPGHHAAEPADPPGPGRGPPLAHPVQPAEGDQREARPGTRGHLLRRGVLRLGRDEQAARLRRPVLRRRPRLDPEALHGSFQLYRAFGATTAQNEERKTRRLPMPVLAMGGAESLGAMAADTMKLTADDVQTLVIPDIGHWLAEQAPEEMVAALTAFLAPYRRGA